MKKSSKQSGEYVYLGETLLSIGGVRQKFRGKKGDHAYFVKIKGLIFGDCVQIVKDQLPVRPKPLERPTLKPTEAEKLEFEAQKEIIKYHRQRQQRAMQVKKPHPDIVRALALLRPFCRNMDMITLGRFAGYLENQLSKRKRRRR